MATLVVEVVVGVVVLMKLGVVVMEVGKEVVAVLLLVVEVMMDVVMVVRAVVAVEIKSSETLALITVNNYNEPITL